MKSAHAWVKFIKAERVDYGLEDPYIKSPAKYDQQVTGSWPRLKIRLPPRQLSPPACHQNSQWRSWTSDACASSTSIIILRWLSLCKRIAYNHVQHTEKCWSLWTNYLFGEEIYPDMKLLPLVAWPPSTCKFTRVSRTIQEPLALFLFSISLTRALILSAKSITTERPFRAEGHIYYSYVLDLILSPDYQSHLSRSLRKKSRRETYMADFLGRFEIPSLICVLRKFPLSVSLSLRLCGSASGIFDL